MKHDYNCMDCSHIFPIEITQEEYSAALIETHSEACPKCARIAGTGQVDCRACAHSFVARFPHGHVNWLTRLVQNATNRIFRYVSVEWCDGVQL